MTTPPAVAEPGPAEPDLPARLPHHSRLMIEAELRRLSRRAPTLTPTQLDVVGDAMRDLAAATLDRMLSAQLGDPHR